MPSPSESPLSPEMPVPDTRPVPPPPEPDEPEVCVEPEGCADCGVTPHEMGDRDGDGIPEDGGRGGIQGFGGRGWLAARAAIAQAAPRRIARRGGQAAGSPFRINAANGRLRTAIAPPSSSAFEVTPRFYYNGASLGATEYGYGWTGTLRRTVTEIDSSTADLTTETGAVLRYTNKDAGGVYTAPGRARNGLKKNTDGTWTETCPDGFLYQYATDGLLSTMENYRGSTWTLNRDGGGRVTSCVDPFGQRSTIIYDGSNKVQKFQDSSGRITTFTVTSGELRKVTTPELCETEFTYDGSHRMTARVNPAGKRTTFAYDGSSRVTSVHLPNNGRMTYGYLAGDKTKFTDPRSKIWTLQYDASGNPTSEIDPLGNRTTLTWSNDRVTASENAVGTTNFSYATMSYGGKQLATVENPAGQRTTFSYSGDRLAAIVDPLGNRLTQTWDGNNNRTAVVDPLSNRTSFSYNSDGQVTQVEDALNQKTSYIYDSSGKLEAIKDALNQRATYSYNGAGKVQTIKDPLGNVTTFMRDDMNRVVEEVNALGKRTTSTYDTGCRLQAVENALGDITTYQYTDEGLLQVEIDALGNRTTYAYDKAENQTSVTNALGKITTSVYDDRGLLRAAVTPLNKRTTFSHDSAGRQIAVQNPLGHITTTNYDSASRVQSVQDAEGNRTTNTYDAAGQLKSVQNALNLRTTYSYDAAGRLKTITDANAKVKTFSYDKVGQMSSETDPLGRITTLGYDAVGQQKFKLDARGVRTTYTYDAAGRLTKRQYTNDATVTLAYDAVGNQTMVQDGNGTTTMQYDAVNQLQSVQDPTGKRLTYTYDKVGQRKTLLAADGGTLTYSYDAAGQLTSLINPESERTTYSYDAAGRRQKKELSNATVASFTYDDADRLTGLRNETTGGTVISRFTYTYDKVGNRLSQDEGSGNLVTWTYDKTYRLTRDRRSGTNSYDTTSTYDPVGNRTVKIDSGARTTTMYDAANQITTSVDSSGTTTFTYDSAGNLRSQQSPTNQRTTHTWNDENRQTKLEVPGGAVTTYTYRWDGLRYAKITASSTRRFVYDGQNYLLENDGSNVIQSVMTNEPLAYGNLVSQRIRLAGTTWAPVYYHYDALGSTRQLTNNSATIANTYIYNAWGQTISSSEAIFNQFLWVGELGYYHDDESDDYYVRARYYDLATGRWMSVDILDDLLGTAPYTYVVLKPAGLVDPSGLRPPRPVDCISCTTAFSASATLCILSMSVPGAQAWAIPTCCVAVNMLACVARTCSARALPPRTERLIQWVERFSWICTCWLPWRRIWRGIVPRGGRPIPPPTPTPDPPPPLA